MSWVRCFGVFLAGLAIGTPVQAAHEWTLDYEDQSTNSFIHQDRARDLIESTIPGELSADVHRALGGPPDPVYVTDARYFSASACVPRMCDMKSLFWLDTATGDALGAVVLRSSSAVSLTLGSRSLSAEEIPSDARTALLRWLTEHGVSPGSVRFLDGENKPTELNAADFQPRVGFVPDADGPSFDCARASTTIEQTLCANQELSRLDLQLASQYEAIRIGHSRLSARQQLLDLQREWLRERNRECVQSSDMVGCLRESYRQQYDRLRNWVPAR